MAPQDTNDFCSHHGYEPIPEHYYILCVECGHVYVTADELVIRDQTIRLEMQIPGDEGDPRPASEINVCPLCTHDF